MESDASAQLNDALVADLLAQFNASARPAAPRFTAAKRDVSENAVAESVVPDNIATEMPNQMFSPPQMPVVEIPSIANSDEYDYLPGHFDVRCVISEAVDAGKESYLVELRSGEIETISSSRLESLDNGPIALSNFQNSERYSISSSSSDTVAASEEDDRSSDSHSQRGKRRSTRLKRTTFTDFFDGISSDNGMGRSSRGASSDGIFSPFRKTTKQRRLRRGRRREMRLDITDEASDFASKGTRFSTRQRKVLRRNLRELYEYEISENEGHEKRQKFHGARETFNKAPLEDPFRLKHQDSCDYCYVTGDDCAKGPLVFCQGCTSAYHRLCLGPRATREHLVTKVSDSLFLLQCRRCLGVAHAKDSTSPHLGCCTVCHEKGDMAEPLKERLTPKQEQQLRQDNDDNDPITVVDEARINNLDNLFFRCISCHRAFHFEHLTIDAAWQCQDCSSVPGEIGAIVSWRPTDPQKFTLGSTADVLKETDKEYLIKWKNEPYRTATWMPGSWVWAVASPPMRRGFLRSDKRLKPHMTAEEAIPDDFQRVDIVFDIQYAEDSPHDRTYEADCARVDHVAKAYVKFKGLPYEDAVWDSPPDRNSKRWKDFEAAYKDWVSRDYVHTPDSQSLKKHLAHVRRRNFKRDVVRETQPETMTGGEIMDYQKDGLNWLYYMWFKQQNAILADEMGLGKTIQVIGLFATLIQYHKCWPFLVVVPNSTCSNWRKEIKTWMPSIRVVTYYGSSFSRKLAQKHEMFPGDDGDLKCHVVVTSYETMVDDASRRVLSKVPWAGLVVDEGQRLKNDKSQLYEALSRMSFPFKVLMTGTPLQNNIRELFNLLQFCDPTTNAEDLENEYGTLSKKNIPELHNIIRPFFLRRTKAQVLSFLPPVAQIIVPVSMTVVQKKLYKSILAKDPNLIKTIFQQKNGDGPALKNKQTERHNLNNILMQLRKCLCHPFIYSKAIEERTADAAMSHRNLVDAAGKFQLLELMLPKLQKRGHRVLIFSQFLDNLDIIEDFLDGLMLPHLRLDGRMSSLEKQNVIDEYNAENSPYFAFLLSTRSGGCGDQSGHSRYRQKNKVLVFQLMTRGSAEEKIMQIGKSKMVLDHVLIDRMAAEDDDGQDLESILRHGAQVLFEDDDSRDIHYDSELDLNPPPNEDGKESQFSFARVWANDTQDLGDLLQDTEDSPPSAAVWEKILQEREQAAVDEAKRKAETLGRGKRKRTTVDYSHTATEESPVKVRRTREAESDEEFKGGDVVESDVDSSPETDSDVMAWAAKKKPKAVQPFKRIHSPDDAAASTFPANMDGHIENRSSCLACNQRHPAGSCRLKLAGVEHCGLCGLAHFGVARTCPHLKSDIQVARMLEALKHSAEDPELVLRAKKNT
ncbi:putative chromatin remodeling complex subunit (Chd3) [Aspergillus tanneri]|uniref:Helicase ATP-binding domain-containing protein n=1 Tax=Aspergillus tanneri TaxID=1220188 RepID=A0A5M9MWW5_9EURO|nr:uncharacterized protein ATNIH1004_002521 [Aspergillus tanneri]KAA8649844.1 hypothetical protein ATNIH1004_002521 [Aspergillus tanneri]